MGRGTSTTEQSIATLEVERARQRLESYCARRNTQQHGAPGWRLISEGDALLVCQAGDAARLFKLCFRAPRWQLYTADSDGRWQPYPLRYEVTSIDAVIAELEQAPLHIHW